MIFNISDGALKTPELNASYPANATVKSGTNAAFKVEISKAGIPSTYTYQWYVNDTAVSGATGATYTRSTSSDKGVYSVYCKVTNKAGTVVSRTATLTVNKTPVLNTSYPANATVVKGNSVTSKVTISTAGYPTSYTYQWYKNGSAVSGATSATYSFTPTAIGTTTVYCKVTNSAGSVNSRTATITATGLYLYNRGNKCTNVTGDWAEVKNTNGTITWNSNNLYLGYVSSASRYASVYTNSKVKMDDYKKLCIRISGLSISDRFLFGVIATPYTGNSGSTAKRNYTAVTDLTSADSSAAEQVLELDISAVTGSLHVQLVADVSKVNVYELYLE